MTPSLATCNYCHARFPYRQGMTHKCEKTPKWMREAAKPKARRGARHEAALYAAMDADELYDLGGIPIMPLDSAEVRRLYVRGYAWGLYLNPTRLFQSDAAFPAARVLVEVDGGAHAAGKAKQKSDTERRGLAGAAGWRIVAVTPEQVTDGTALALIRRALEAK